MNLTKPTIIKLMSITLMLTILSCLYIWAALNQKQIISGQDITIQSGASSFSISRHLEENQIISSARYFRWLARITNTDAKLKPGLYRFEGLLNTFDVIDTLTKGKIQQFKVTIPEGLRTDEMLVLLSDRTGTALKKWQDAMQGITHGMEFEGLFLPETYLYTKPVNPYLVLKKMFEAREKVESDLTRELGWSEEQIKRNRIMASIVEKETALAHERGWVSAAIHNRIQQRMPLQMDPTVIYGIYRTQSKFSGNLRKKDLKADTAWNTYTRRGLPLTPICNPGAESLRAAAYPENVDYLYFVADGTGGHAFASTLDEHNANVRKWIKIERKNNRQ